MEPWLQTALQGAIGSSPVAIVLGVVAWKLWGKVEQKDKDLTDLHQARVSDLKAVVAKDSD